MAQSCTKAPCHPDDTGCNLGAYLPSQCEYYRPNGEAKTQPQPEDEARRIPWTGNSLGLQNLLVLSARSRLTIIGVVGAASAGKTTFLASLFCLLRHGYEIGGYRFAGSYTLLGWENLAWYLTWKAEGQINFPPHTSSNSGRVPGLLHLTLRDKNGTLRDIVLTDAPGEWFPAWAVNKHDANAAGAAWMYEHADAFLLFADSQRLTGPQQGTSRNQLQQIGERLKENLGARPLGLVWAKSDVDVPAAGKSKVAGYLTNSPLAHFREFEVSVQAGPERIWHRNILATMEWVLFTVHQPIGAYPSVAVARPDDLFLSKRSLSA